MHDMTTAIHRTRNRPVPQSQPLRADQIRNSAGGYVFQVSNETALRRFLLLGTEGGTYYQSEHALTQQGMALVEQCAASMPASKFIDIVVECANTAPKRTYALYALAVALGSENAHLKDRAVSVVREIVKTGTDFFELISYIEASRGWGAVAKRALNEVLLKLDVEKLGLWTVKYRDRHGWTWRDALRIAHPKRNTEELHNQRRSDLFDVMLDKPKTTDVLVVDGWQEVKSLTKSADIIAAVQKYGLPWEALTDEQRTDEVWKACLPFIGEQAVLRNLASFTRRGLQNDREFALAIIDRLEKAKRLHPITVLNALKTYQSGGSIGRSKGGSYLPYGPWVSAIEAAMEASFQYGVTSHGTRTYIGLDVSGSMGSRVSGSEVLTCREVGAALALAYIKAEPLAECLGFTKSSNGVMSRTPMGPSGLTHLGLSKATSFSDAVRKTSGLSFGGTDCALPVLDAISRKLLVDLFVVITDNETWAGSIHASEALKQYRAQSGVNAKLAVVALTYARGSVADPRDAGMMDFVGFSSDLPKSLEVFATL